jgi:hypothetical protein
MRPPAAPASSGAAPWAAQYRHTTPEMAARIAVAIEQRLTVVLRVAERALAPEQEGRHLMVRVGS